MPCLPHLPGAATVSEVLATGGISVANAPDYLALPNVGCVGGSWITPPNLLREKNWDAVTSLAVAATYVA